MKTMQFYEKKSGLAFNGLENKVAFFNMDEKNSTVRPIACGRSYKCFEETEMYAMFGECSVFRSSVTK